MLLDFLSAAHAASARQLSRCRRRAHTLCVPAPAVACALPLASLCVLASQPVARQPVISWPSSSGSRLDCAQQLFDPSKSLSSSANTQANKAAVLPSESLQPERRPKPPAPRTKLAVLALAALCASERLCRQRCARRTRARKQPVSEPAGCACLPSCRNLSAGRLVCWRLTCRPNSSTASTSHIRPVYTCFLAAAS